MRVGAEHPSPEFCTVRLEIIHGRKWMIYEGKKKKITQEGGGGGGVIWDVTSGFLEPENLSRKMGFGMGQGPYWSSRGKSGGRSGGLIRNADGVSTVSRKDYSRGKNLKNEGTRRKKKSD